MEGESALPSTAQAPADEKAQHEPQQDAEMGDAQPQPQASGAAPAGSQNDDAADTQLSDVPLESPIDDVSFGPSRVFDIRPDGSQEQVSAPVTGDTSMADPPSQPTTKIAHEREEDDDAEVPLAKRPKVGEVRGTIAKEPEPQPEPQPVAGEQGALAVDRGDRAPPPRKRPLGEPGSLGDPAQESEPISGFAIREIRKLISGQKKTKNGNVFKDPVSAKWPQLWSQYLDKIEKPMDLNQIDRNIRDATYATLGEFVEDVYLIQENCAVFNGKDHDVTGQATALVDTIFTKLAEIPAQEPASAPKRQAKPAPTRHAEPRAAAQPRRESRGAATSPTEKVIESPVFAIPPSGVPIIRRDSTKNDGDRPKRPIHPPKNKDLGYEPKNLKKKKISPEFRFCDEVVKELMKNKHWDANQWFMQPVDAVRDQVPDYHRVIKKPMDLGTMQAKLNSGEYNSAKEFESDFNLIIKNCRKFNSGGGLVVVAADKLEKLFTEKWAEKDEWMASHAPPPSAGSPSGPARDESDDEDGSEHEGEDDDAPLTSETLDKLNERLEEEQKRLTALLTSKVPDITMVNTQQNFITMIMNSIVDERKRLASVPKKSSKGSKSKTSKSKKASLSGTAAASSGGRKAATAAGVSTGSKKSTSSGKKTPKARVMGQTEKNVVTEGINNLAGNQLERAIEIIKRDTSQEVGSSAILAELSVNIP